MKKPEDIKKALDCCASTTPIYDPCGECSYAENRFGACSVFVCYDALALIQQLEEDKKRLQERICNQRRQLRVLHAMYEWALGRLQKAKLNDRAHFQAFLRERGYDLATMELPEVPKEEPC